MKARILKTAPFLLLLFVLGSLTTVKAQNLDVERLMQSKNLSSIYLSRAMLQEASKYLGEDIAMLGIDLSQAKGIYIFQSDGNSEGAELLREVYGPIRNGYWKNYRRLGAVNKGKEKMHLYGKRYGNRYSSLHYLSDLGKNVMGIVIMGLYSNDQIDRMLNASAAYGIGQGPYNRGRGNAYGHSNKAYNERMRDIKMSHKQIERQLKELERELKRADRDMRKAISKAEKQAAKARRDALKARRNAIKLQRKRYKELYD